MPAQRPSDATRARLSKAVAGPKPSPTERQHPTEPETDTRPAMRRRGTKRQQQGINWDTDLLLYSRDVVDRLRRAYPSEPGTASLAALVDQAVREKIADFERRFNNGEPFPPIAP